MELKDLIEGEIYYHQYAVDNGYIFQYGKREENRIGYDKYIYIKGRSFHIDSKAHNGKSYEKLRKTTNLESQWLQNCIKANKYVECPTIEKMF